MKPADAVELDKNLHKVEVGSAAAVRITREAKLRATAIVEKSEKVVDQKKAS